MKEGKCEGKGSARRGLEVRDTMGEERKEWWYGRKFTDSVCG